MGDLPSPLREVMSMEEETDNDDADEIFFTVPEELIEKDVGGEGTVHTGSKAKHESTYLGIYCDPCRGKYSML
jgi:hypothetical protein